MSNYQSMWKNQALLPLSFYCCIFFIVSLLISFFYYPQAENNLHTSIGVFQYETWRSEQIIIKINGKRETFTSGGPLLIRPYKLVGRTVIIKTSYAKIYIMSYGNIPVITYESTHARMCRISISWAVIAVMFFIITIFAKFRNPR
jgi:hypothetical protein